MITSTLTIYSGEYFEWYQLTDLSFFPINNNLDRMHSYIPKWFKRLFYTADELDDGLGNLRNEIERVIKDSECRKEQKPLA